MQIVMVYVYYYIVIYYLKKINVLSETNRVNLEVHIYRITMYHNTVFVYVWL